MLDPAQLAEEAPSRMRKQLPLPHPGTRFSNCSVRTQNLQCFLQRAAGQLSPASLQPQHLLISSDAYLTPGVPQFPGPVSYPHRLQTLVHAAHTTYCLPLDTPPGSTCIFSVLSRESWKTLPPHVQLWSGSEEKSTSPSLVSPELCLPLTWRAWWLALAATPLNLHSPKPQ